MILLIFFSRALESHGWDVYKETLDSFVLLLRAVEYRGMELTGQVFSSVVAVESLGWERVLQG